MWLGTSWKMTKTLAEARAWVRAVTAEPVPEGVATFVLPAHTALASVAAAVPSGHGLRVGAQDAHWDTGPEWTGEVSTAQVRDAGAVLVEVGHSERRAHLGDDDLVVARKVRAVVDAGLTPLLCVGEPVAADTGRRVDHVVEQLRAGLRLLSPFEASGALVAYEPVWSIGRAGTPASPEAVAPVVAALRDAVMEWTAVRGPRALLYGGSVGPENAPGLLEVDGVDGLFVGRSAWDPEGFLALQRLVARASAAQRAGSRVTQ